MRKNVIENKYELNVAPKRAYLQREFRLSSSLEQQSSLHNIDSFAKISQAIIVFFNGYLLEILRINSCNQITFFKYADSFQNYRRTTTIARCIIPFAYSTRHEYTPDGNSLKEI